MNYIIIIIIHPGLTVRLQTYQGFSYGRLRQLCISFISRYADRQENVLFAFFFFCLFVCLITFDVPSRHRIEQNKLGFFFVCLFVCLLVFVFVFVFVFFFFVFFGFFFFIAPPVKEIILVCSS